LREHKGENLKPDNHVKVYYKQPKTNNMKKVKFVGKLSLNKVTVAKLNNDQMAKVVGGGDEPKKPSTTKLTNNTCGYLCTY
jgi:natural product precursor